MVENGDESWTELVLLRSLLNQLELTANLIPMSLTVLVGNVLALRKLEQADITVGTF